MCDEDTDYWIGHYEEVTLRIDLMFNVKKYLCLYK